MPNDTRNWKYNILLLSCWEIKNMHDRCGVHMKKQFLAILMSILCLVGCGEQKGQNIETIRDEKEVLVLAVFDENPEVNKQVELFNQNNNTYKIEIQKYGRAAWTEDDGIARLQREIISGEGPDIIDFGWDYTTSDITGRNAEGRKLCIKEK